MNWSGADIGDSDRVNTCARCFAKDMQRSPRWPTPTPPSQAYDGDYEDEKIYGNKPKINRIKLRDAPAKQHVDGPTHRLLEVLRKADADLYDDLRLQHPHILPFTFWEQEGADIFYVVPSGKGLRQRCAEGAPEARSRNDMKGISTCLDVHATTSVLRGESWTAASHKKLGPRIRDEEDIRMLEGIIA